MKTILLLLLPMAFLTACKRNTSVADGHDNQEGLVVSEKQYQAAVTDNYTISKAVIEGDSLFITFGAGGCNSDRWKTSLIDAGRVAESNPVQRYLKLRLVNPEACAAYFSKKTAINIRPLRVAGTTTVSFNLAKWNQSLLYAY